MKVTHSFQPQKKVVMCKITEVQGKILHGYKKNNDFVYRFQLNPESKPKVVHLKRLSYHGRDL